MSKLILIDGNAIMHRAYHALPPLTTRAGEPINAVYGFVTMLLRIISDLKPTHIVACFDRKEPTFRKKEYKKYQSHRPEMDKELGSQFPKVQKVVRAMNLPMKDKKGFEADDVIGTLTKKALKEKVDEIIIVTGDKDIMQLVSDRVKLYMPVRGLGNADLVGENEVIKKLGVRPDQVIDYKAMAGDSSDNYPGIKGVGHVTASALLLEYGDLATIYKNLDKLKPAVKKKFEEQKENAQLSQRLATIVTDVKVEYDAQLASFWQLDNPKVVKLFEEFGFRTLTARIKAAGKRIEMEKQGKLF